MSVKSFASSTRTSRSTVRSNVLTAKSSSTTRKSALSFATKSNSTGALPPKGTASSISSSSRSNVKSSTSQCRVTEPKTKPIKSYDPLEDLQRHYLEGDDGIRSESEDEAIHDEAHAAGAGFLQKSLKYQQLNDNLEKTSKDLFQRIDAYIANKTLQNARRNEPEVDSNDNTLKPPGNGFSFENPQLLSPSDQRSENSDTETSATTSSMSSFSSSLDKKQIKSSSSSLPSKNVAKTSKVKVNGDPIDEKTRQRLQKASESVINCLQSKLTSYEGRIADMNLQYRQKVIQENTMLESKIKLLEDDREKLLKSNSTLQTTAEKHAKAAEVAKADLNLKSQALATAKKEMEVVKKELRMKTTALQNLQQKVNRLTEDNDRLKHQTRSTQMNMRDKQHEDRSVIDELHQRVNQLEQQKTILNSTISKQTLLIKALRTQRTSNPGQDKPTFY